MSLTYKNDNFSNRLFQAWFLDDGVLAGKKASVLRAVSILEEFGPSLGIFINLINRLYAEDANLRPRSSGRTACTPCTTLPVVITYRRP